MTTGRYAATWGAAAATCSRPRSDRAESRCPCHTRAALSTVSAWRITTIRRGDGPPGTGLTPGRPRRPRSLPRLGVVLRRTRERLDAREVDLGAVLPEPLEGVVVALLLVLHVHDDVAEVDEHPATLALALTAQRLAAELAEPVLDLVDDGADLALGGGGGDDEDVGERHLVTHVDRHHLLGDLLLGGQGGHLGELERAFCGSHGSPMERAGVHGGRSPLRVA